MRQNVILVLPVTIAQTNPLLLLYVQKTSPQIQEPHIVHTVLQASVQLWLPQHLKHALPEPLEIIQLKYLFVHNAHQSTIAQLDQQFWYLKVPIKWDPLALLLLVPLVKLVPGRISLVMTVHQVPIRIKQVKHPVNLALLGMSAHLPEQSHLLLVALVSTQCQDLLTV